MTILPVIDILNGTAVRGVAGNRDDYRPIQSRWTESADPGELAAALRAAFGFRRYYVADLDGILHRRPNRELFRRLTREHCELIVDAGIQVADDAPHILNDGVHAVIAGLETLHGPAELAELIQRHGPERIVFSLDLRSGISQIAEGAVWPNSDPLSIARTAANLGVAQMIVLDLADVGVGTGGSTRDLCRTILDRHPQLRLITGGGVRGETDVERWAETGVSELLVASALHDGRLSPEFVRQYH